ncbi:MAG: nucleotidyltransferase family protein [Chloroflexi bacterium]|nr:MAG: nucleotidyltransferase family protein [Chloroflexota bacterium]
MVVNDRLRANIDVSPRTAAFYDAVITALEEERLPFMLGGAFAFEVYTDIGGQTKDLDLFLHPRDVDAAMAALAKRGYETEMKARHWLGKVKSERDFVDIIFGSGNGLAPVDDAWFEHALPAEVLGHEVRLIPVEEMLWSKSFIMERERYDGADIAHLIRVAGRTMDWRRLVDRFDRFWPVLLAHVVLYDFVYPADRGRVPDWVRAELLGRAQEGAVDPAAVEDRVCFGTALSRAQYLPDVEGWGYRDGRLSPYGGLTESDVEHETARMRKELDL